MDSIRPDWPDLRSLLNLSVTAPTKFFLKFRICILKLIFSAKYVSLLKMRPEMENSDSQFQYDWQEWQGEGVYDLARPLSRSSVYFV